MNCCRQCAAPGALNYYPTRIRVRRRPLSGFRGLGDGAAIPAGSQLTYTVKYQNSWNPLNASFWSATIAGQIAAVKANLQSQWNIALLNYQDNTGFGASANLTLNLQTLADYGAVADIKSIIDGAFYNAAGISVSASTLSVSLLASPGSAGAQSNIAPPPQPPPAPFDLASWLTDNWMYLAAGVAGAVVLQEVL